MLNMKASTDISKWRYVDLKGQENVHCLSNNDDSSKNKPKESELYSFIGTSTPMTAHIAPIDTEPGSKVAIPVFQVYFDETIARDVSRLETIVNKEGKLRRIVQSASQKAEVDKRPKNPHQILVTKPENRPLQRVRGARGGVKFNQVLEESKENLRAERVESRREAKPFCQSRERKDPQTIIQGDHVLKDRHCVTSESKDSMITKRQKGQKNDNKSKSGSTVSKKGGISGFLKLLVKGDILSKPKKDFKEPAREAKNGVSAAASTRPKEYIQFYQQTPSKRSKRPKRKLLITHLRKLSSDEVLNFIRANEEPLSRRHLEAMSAKGRDPLWCKHEMRGKKKETLSPSKKK